MDLRRKLAGVSWTGAAIMGAAVLTAGGLLWGFGTARVGPWQLTRSAGIIAYLLLWGSVVLGLWQTTGWMKGLITPLVNMGLHEHLSLWALYTTVFHVVILRWDSYVSFSWTDLLVPFASAYQPVLLALGILSFYILGLTVVTTYLRGRLGTRLWRVIHQVSLLAFLGALIHGVLMGTDTVSPAMGFIYRFTGISAGLLAGLRLVHVLRRRTATSVSPR